MGTEGIVGIEVLHMDGIALVAISDRQQGLLIQAQANRIRRDPVAEDNGIISASATARTTSNSNIAS